MYNLRMLGMRDTRIGHGICIRNSTNVGVVIITWQCCPNNASGAIEKRMEATEMGGACPVLSRGSMLK